MTINEAKTLVAELKKVFDTVRFVDVSMTLEFDINDMDFVHRNLNCYAVWNKTGRCENCISSKAYATKSRLTKYEFINQDIYYVVAKYFEVEGAGLVLEVVSKVTDEILFGALGKEKIIQKILEYNDKLYKDPLPAHTTGAISKNSFNILIKIALPWHLSMSIISSR